MQRPGKVDSNKTEGVQNGIREEKIGLYHEPGVKPPSL